jgi:outer membrane protein insertion porin family
MKRLSLFAATVLLAATTAAPAQYTVEAVVFQGAAPYTDSELLSVCGLHSGQKLGRDSLVQAAHRLLDTGLFDDAQVDLTGSGAGRTVRIAVKPTPLAKLLPVSFENLVWFTPDELTAGLHTALPLYRGVASDAGNFPDAIQSALEQMLTAKSISATLTHTFIEPTTQHPLRVIAFRVEQPSVRIANVHLSITGPPGAATELAPLLGPVLGKAAGAPYNEGLAGFTLEDRLLAPVRDAGYIAAQLGPVERTIASSGTATTVNVTTRVLSGDPYKLSSLTWQPTPLYSAADFARDATLHAGDLASAKALTATEAPILAAYRSQGYMDAYLDPAPTLDPTTHTVAYSLHVVSGDPYRLKSVTPLNLSPTAQKEFDSGWRMKPGDIYNLTYVETFIRNNTALQNLATYSAAFQTSADPTTHLVDLTITFIPGPRTR